MLRWLEKDDICDKVLIVVNECSRGRVRERLEVGLGPTFERCCLVRNSVPRTLFRTVIIRSFLNFYWYSFYLLFLKLH